MRAIKTNAEKPAWSRRYLEALRRHLAQGPEASRRTAHGLGIQAVALGLEMLDLAMMHEQALTALALSNKSSASRDRIIRQAGFFFIEAIVPLEKTHRAAQESNGYLSRLNHVLSRRTLELVVSNRNLKKEISRRMVVERTLRQSEQHTRQLLEQSRKLQEQLRHLSRRILSAQEEERKRISRELHDVIAQVLAGINVRLAGLKTDAMVNARGLTRNIARTQMMVEKSVDIVHRFAYDLRPAVLDHLGLIPARHSFVKSFAQETGVRVQLTVFAAVEKLSSDKRTVIYRVVHEALTNVGRHAHASHVEVRIQRLPRAVSMRIKDNGQAFDAEKILHSVKNKRMGLLGMRERVEMVGGDFSVVSAPGQGTVIKARIPFRYGDLAEPAHS